MTGARKPNVKEPVVVEDEAKVEAKTAEPEFKDVRPGDPDVPEGDLKFEQPEPEPESDVSVQEPDKVEPEEWFPGRPCLNCGSQEYTWAIGWGTTCSECSPEAVAAREAAE